MQSSQLRLFNAFKRSGFNEDDAMDVASIVEKASDISDIRKDVSDMKADISSIKHGQNILQWIIGLGFTVLFSMNILILSTLFKMLK